MSIDTSFLDQLQTAITGGGAPTDIGPPPILPLDLSTLTPGAFDVAGSVVGAGGAGIPQFFFDNTTGRTVSAAEALVLDPVAFRQDSGLTDAQIAAIRDEGLTSQGGEQPFTGAPPRPSFLDNLKTQLQKNPVGALGLTLSVGTGIAGIAAAIAGMTRNASGGSTLRLPNGQTLQLSPQEAQAAQLALRQAQQEAGISDATMPAVLNAARASSGDLTSTLTGGAATGAGAIGNLSDLLASDRARPPGELPMPSYLAGTTRSLNLSTQQVQDALEGKVPVNPALATQIDLQRKQLHAQLQEELGPGWDTSTPGMDAINKFEVAARGQIANDNRIQLGLAQGVASQTAGTLQAGLNLSDIARHNQFGRAFNVGTWNLSPSGPAGMMLGRQPGQLALGNLSAFAPRAMQQTGQAFDVNQFNALRQLMQNQTLTQGGGQLFGLAASPFFSAASKNLFSLAPGG